MTFILAAIGAALVITLAVIGGLALWGLLLGERDKQRNEDDDEWPSYKRQ